MNRQYNMIETSVDRKSFIALWWCVCRYVMQYSSTYLHCQRLNSDTILWLSSNCYKCSINVVLTQSQSEPNGHFLQWNIEFNQWQYRNWAQRSWDWHTHTRTWIYYTLARKKNDRNSTEKSPIFSLLLSIRLKTTDYEPLYHLYIDT